MAIPLIIGAAIVAGAGIAKAISGAKQRKQGRTLEANNIRPNYDISDEYFENRDLAAEMAQSGLGEDALNFYRTNAERGLSSGVGAILQSGGGPNAISGIYDAFQQGLGGIAAADAQARTNNLRYFMDRNADVAQQRTMQWALDKYQPYKDKAALAAQLQAQGTENIYSGISQVGSAVASYGKAGNFSSLGGNAGGNGLSSAQQVTNVLPNAQVVSMAAPSSNVISNSLDGMQNSPYLEAIERRLRQYGTLNPQ